MSITRITALVGFLAATVIYPCVRADEAGEALRAGFERAFTPRAIVATVAAGETAADDPLYRLVSRPLWTPGASQGSGLQRVPEAPATAVAPGAPPPLADDAPPAAFDHIH